ncbi:MAG: lipoyl domain-containing protein [Steroidobacteraceae bacterium]|nr:biotin/lipoyl-binding protein [Nevskiaceae bacterium]MCP5359798.1 biotin/lipoyl-binding protein [Nevskiaceae bacterium]MCP5467405.1 biotin/lipoyl-binding protein [Nevskiaceae bacterium]MCP5472712.1 biotin/lipoyl-binding protein [Nevskiaceae bacterium]
MSTQILFPKIGFAMEEGTLAEWHVHDGAEVVAGQPLYVLESEKSAQDIESPASGTVRISVAAGTQCKVGDVLGEIV